jgi:hypothetical protein
MRIFIGPTEIAGIATNLPMDAAKLMLKQKLSSPNHNRLVVIYIANNKII